MAGEHTALRVIHDPDMPLEHPSLDVLVWVNEQGLIEMWQGTDQIVMPPEHSNRVFAAVLQLSALLGTEASA